MAGWNSGKLTSHRFMITLSIIQITYNFLIMKQSQFKKRRITPLALLSQVKKNNNPLLHSRDALASLPNLKDKSKQRKRYED